MLYPPMIVGVSYQLLCCEYMYMYDLNILSIDHVLLFYKYYDPTKGMLMYMGHIIVPVTIKFGKSN